MVTGLLPRLATSEANIVAANIVWLKTVVSRSTLLIRTFDVHTKLFPVTNNLNVGWPTPTAGGPSTEIEGTGFVVGIGQAAGVMVNITALDGTPPGSGRGLNTGTVTWPTPISTATPSCAVNLVEVTKVVGTSPPSGRTLAPLTNMVPFTVRVSGPLPSGADVGDRDVITGVGLGPMMVKVWAVDVPPPGVGVKTVTAAVPEFARSDAGITAVNCVESM